MKKPGIGIYAYDKEVIPSLDTSRGTFRQPTQNQNHSASDSEMAVILEERWLVLESEDVEFLRK